MIWIILALLIGLPLIEISVFIEIGSEIGALSTVVITVLTAVAGTLLLRIQGIGVLRRAQASMARQEAPVEEIFQGVFLALAGLMLLIPGFVTDAIGFLFFLPPVRHYLGRRLMRHVQTKHRQGFTANGSSSSYKYQSRPGNVIEGEYDVVQEKEDKKIDADAIEPGEPSENSPWSKNSDPDKPA